MGLRLRLCRASDDEEEEEVVVVGGGLKSDNRVCGVFRLAVSIESPRLLGGKKEDKVEEEEKDALNDEDADDKGEKSVSGGCIVGLRIWAGDVSDGNNGELDWDDDEEEEEEEEGNLVSISENEGIDGSKVADKLLCSATFGSFKGRGIEEEGSGGGDGVIKGIEKVIHPPCMEGIEKEEEEGSENPGNVNNVGECE